MTVFTYFTTGQRGQLVVITKVESRYRSLSAVHHQSLYGQEAVKRLLQLLKMFSTPTNAASIHQELEQARHYENDDTFWNQMEDQERFRPENTARFPLITTCLLTGASFDPFGCCGENASPYPFNVTWNAGDNNGGMMIIDITDSSRLSYCYVANHRCNVLIVGSLSKPLIH